MKLSRRFVAFAGPVRKGRSGCAVWGGGASDRGARMESFLRTGVSTATVIIEEETGLCLEGQRREERGLGMLGETMLRGEPLI